MSILNTVYVKSYKLPEYNINEIIRYAGTKELTPEMNKLLEKCLSEVRDKLSGKVCYCEFPIECRGEVIDLTFTKTNSAALRKNLNGCDSVIVFGATVGIELDRIIARYGASSPAAALMFQAIGAERIEALCNLFNDEITKQKEAHGKTTTPRFSPGYGDLSIEIQRDIFRILDCPRKIGLMLNQSLLMSPSKSVTAIIGISNTEQKQRSGCISCDKKDCIYRRTI